MEFGNLPENTVSFFSIYMYFALRRMTDMMVRELPVSQEKHSITEWAEQIHSSSISGTPNRISWERDAAAQRVAQSPPREGLPAVMNGSVTGEPADQPSHS